MNCYELILNHITFGEYAPPNKESFENYKQVAYLFLNHKGKFLFKDEILKQYSEGTVFEAILEQEKHRFWPGANHVRDGKREQVWYDLWSTEEIERNDDFFDYFFACKLRHLDLLRIDEFLAFHLGYSFKNKKEEFSRFLSLCLRKYKNNLLNSDILETSKEWMAYNINENKTIGSLGYNQEQANEKTQYRAKESTILSQNQTALLIQFMQKTGILLKDNSLTNRQAGKAFNILTGYSPETLRQQLGKRGEVQGVKHEDYKELYDIVIKMAKQIEENVRK